LFKIQTGTFATHGFVVCLLPQTVVALSEKAESFQVLQRLVRWHGLTTDAAGMIAGPILENSMLVACLTAVGTVVKGWNDFKKYSFKVDTSRFAFTTYAKALIELRTYVCGIPFEGVEGFLIKRWMTPSLILPRHYPNVACKNTTVSFSVNPWVRNATWMDVIVP